jgi:hypothetical protein
MTTVDKIKAIDLRIALLKARGETMNVAIIRKLERRKRALQTQA